MVSEFEPKNEAIVLESSINSAEKIAFVQNLYNKAQDKINHFDKLRQQILNYAVVVFSALLAFVLKSEDAALQSLACFGISGLMAIFRALDQRYHTSTHGFAGSMIIFNQVIASLLNNPDRGVQVLQYHTPSEARVQQWSLQTKIYLILGLGAFALGLFILFDEIALR